MKNKPKARASCDYRVRSGMPDDIDDAEIIEGRASELHPLLGQLSPAPPDEPVFILPEPPPAPRPLPGVGDPAVRGSFVGKMFCDTCGFTGGHAPDCPASLPPPDEDDEPAGMTRRAGIDDDEAVIPLARKLVGAVLRKMARIVEGR